MALRIIFSAAVFTGLIILAITMGGSVSSFIDIPSLIIVLGCLSAGTIWSFPLNHIMRAMAVPFQSRPEEEQARQAHFVFTKMAELSVGAGLLGTLIGLVQMLRHLDDPTAIGPAMAVALLTLLYGVILGEFVFKSMASSCLSQNNLFERGKQRGFVSLHMATAALFGLLFTFFVMLLAMTG